MIEPYVWVCPPGTPKSVTPSKELGCVRLKALIDTGAECSFINTKKVKKLKGFTEKRCRRPVAAMCGGSGAAWANSIDIQIAAPGCPPAEVCALGANGQPVEGVDLVVGFDYMKKVGMWVKVAAGRGGGTFGCAKGTAGPAKQAKTAPKKKTTSKRTATKRRR